MHKPLLAIDILATLLAVVASFFLAQSKLVAPLADVTSEASGVNETVLRFMVGVLVAVLAGYLTYTLISQLWVKLLVVVGSIVLLGAYLYILAILPG